MGEPLQNAWKFISASGLTQEEKDTLGGILLDDENLADRINLIHTDRALRVLIQQRKISVGVTTLGENAGNYAEGNEIYEFWSAVVQPGAVNVDSTGKILSFNNGTLWGWKRDVDELYIRNCYIKAIAILDRSYVAIIDGTPGIDRDGVGYFLRVDENGNGIVHKPTTATPDYLITDTIGRSTPSFTKLYFHVSSINNENVKGVYNMMRKNKPTTNIYLPGFSLVECFEIDGGKVEQVAMNFYYDVFGGSVRNLRSVAQMNEENLYPEDIYKIVQEEMKSFFGDYKLVGVPKAIWDKTAKALAKKLENPSEGSKNSSVVDPNTIIRSIIIHWTPSANEGRGWIDAPATRFMRHLVGHICNTANCDRLGDAIGRSGMGWVHEHDAHQFRLTHLCKEPGITLWREKNNESEGRRLCLPITRVVRIRSVSDIERLEEGDYGLPTVSNFPFVDAVMKPNYIFQDTIAKGHPSVAKVPEILKALKTDEGSVVLVKTLATDNFKMNSSVVVEPFSQWMTRIEPHTDDVAVVKALTVVTAPEKSNSRKRRQRSLVVKPKRKKRMK